MLVSLCQLQTDARRIESVRKGLDVLNQKLAQNQLSASAAKRLGGVCASAKAGDFVGALAQVCDQLRHSVCGISPLLITGLLPCAYACTSTASALGDPRMGRQLAMDSSDQDGSAGRQVNVILFVMTALV